MGPHHFLPLAVGTYLPRQCKQFCSPSTGENKVIQELADVTTMIEHTPSVVDEVLNYKASLASAVITILCRRQQQALLQFTLLGFAEFGFPSRRNASVENWRSLPARKPLSSCILSGH